MIKENNTRFIEIDVLRSLAVTGMIIYHFLFDLNFIFSLEIPVLNGFWIFFAHTTASIFLLLVGISAVISVGKIQSNRSQIVSKMIKRSLTILFFAYLISLITFIIFPSEYIIFGILHLIGYSYILIIPFLLSGSKIYPFIAMLFVYMASFLTKHISPDNPVLIPLGITPSGFSSFDYFPIIPWFGIILLGIFTGKIYYPWRVTKKNSPKTEIVLSLFQFVGQHSLAIYLFHQPILFSLLSLFKYIYVKN